MKSTKTEYLPFKKLGIATIETIDASIPIGNSLEIINSNFYILQQKICILNDSICQFAASLSAIVTEVNNYYNYIYFNHPEITLPIFPAEAPVINIEATTTPLTGAEIPWSAPNVEYVPFSLKNL
jgi:hypothetical protein